MGRLVVEELVPEGGELGEVAEEGAATRVLVEGAFTGWLCCTGEWFLLRFVPKVNDLKFNRELIRSIWKTG